MVTKGLSEAQPNRFPACMAVFSTTTSMPGIDLAAAASIFVIYLNDGLYSRRVETLNLTSAKTPGIGDRKSVNINNIDLLTIVDPREFSHGPNPKFQPDGSII